MRSQQTRQQLWPATSLLTKTLSLRLLDFTVDVNVRLVDFVLLISDRLSNSIHWQSFCSLTQRWDWLCLCSQIQFKTSFTISHNSLALQQLWTYLDLTTTESKVWIWVSYSEIQSSNIHLADNFYLRNVTKETWQKKHNKRNTTKKTLTIETNIFL